MEVLGNFFSHLWVQLVSLVLLATLHGYAGAWLAVRMLFRPRKPVKIFGLTVFPQGMIPRHRARLAEAIGKAVGEELVSQETVLRELFEKQFLSRKIRSLVDSYTEEILSQNYPSLIEALPSNLRAPVLDAISSLQLKVADHVKNVLQSEESAEAIRAFVNRRIDEVLSQRISTVADDETFLNVVGFLENRIRSIAKEPAFEQNIRDFVSRRVDDLANTETPLGLLFTEDAVALLKEKAGEQIEPLVHQLTELATANRTRDQISALIKKEVHGYYENLPFFKKIFVSRENLLKEVDDLVNESLPKRIEETLRGDFFAEEARSFLDKTIDTALAKPLPQVVGKIAPDQLEKLKSQISKAFLALLQGEEMMNSVSAYLTDMLQKLRPHSIDAVLRKIHPESEEKLKVMLTKGLMSILSRDETSNIVNAVLSRQIDRLLSAPIGKLSDHIAEQKVLAAGKSLTETIISAARERLPEAIKEFDIGAVVREKVNDYPAEKLEALVMSVAREHLRTIELFGALFGFMIGVGQAIQFYFFAR
jgi:uncharacterized membrane protein YheB (UPF0754 family)